MGGSIENDIYGSGHKFGSQNGVSKIVQGNCDRVFSFYMLSRITMKNAFCSEFQKIFPKARDVITQAESVKNDIIVFNREISELNSELQVIPERCPPDVSIMCDMVTANRLHAENYTYLVSTVVRYTTCTQFCSMRTVA